MRNIQKTIGLIVCLLCLLSIQHASAQNYRVKVTLGKVTCDDFVTDSGTEIQEGEVRVTSSLWGELSRSEPFRNVLTNSGEVIYDGVFSLQPNLLFLEIKPSVAGGCGTAVTLSQGMELTRAFDRLNQDVIYEFITDDGGTIQLIVRATGFTLNPGTIGSDQSVCEFDSPEEIRGLTPAQGGAGITYRWEYSDVSYSGPWYLTSPLGTESSYTPPKTSETRWYRRVAVFGEINEPTTPVRVEVYNKEDTKYRFELFLTGYECGGVTDNTQRNLSLDFGSVTWGLEGLGYNEDVPVYEYDFTTLPAGFNLLSSARSIGSSAVCTGDIEGSGLDIPAVNSGKTAYELIDGSQKLKYSIRVIELEDFSLPAGEIEIDGSSEKTVCRGEGPFDITEKVASEIVGGTYQWQWSIDEGAHWIETAGTEIDFQTDALDVTTWYRRVLTKGCAKGVSNTVIIEVEKIVLTIEGLASFYESDASAVTLTGTPTGGVFSGPGVAAGTSVFDPTLSGSGQHTITYTYTSPATGCIYTKTAETFVEVNALCTTRVPLNDNGSFKIDKFSGRIVYQREEDCAPLIEIPCIQKEAETPTLNNVISASAVTLADEWNYKPYTEDKYDTELLGANIFETGEAGKWRVQNSYVYRSSEVNRDKNYNTGTYDLPVFNWRYEDVNARDEWIPASSVVKYSPNGEALEEYNAIGISSTVKMGYYGALPYLTAQNAKHESVVFESFELEYSSDKLESGTLLNGFTAIDDQVSHAGFKSLELDPSEGLSTPLVSNANANTTMLVQFWAKSTPNESFTMNFTSGTDEITIVLSDSFSEIARSGDWGLYQTTVETTGHDSFRFHIVYEGTSKVWIDDLRVQPYDAEMSCYVYDPTTLRLMTVFDGQHFGLYYQYDGEGKLVRKMIETERGVRTVQETFYNTPEVNKNDE